MYRCYECDCPYDSKKYYGLIKYPFFLLFMKIKLHLSILEYKIKNIFSKDDFPF